MSRPSKLNRFAAGPALGIAILAAAASGLVLTAPAVCQEGAGVEWSDRVDVDLVNVEVWVTDGKGRSVTGLLADDFEVTEDGKPVEVTHFAEYRADVGLQTLSLDDLNLEDLSPTGEAPTGSESGAESSEESASEQIEGAEGYLILLFDEVHMGPVGRKRLVKDLKGFLKGGQVPEENILILRRSSHLYVASPLGSDRRDIEKALDGLRRAGSDGTQAWADERQAVRRVQDLWDEHQIRVSGTVGGGGDSLDACVFYVPAAFREVQFYVQNTTERIRRTLSDLRDTASFLAGLPGPKTLLYVADTLTMTPGAAQMTFVSSVCPGENVNRRLDLQDGLNEEFRAMTRHAAANRITFYTLQSLGLRSGQSLSGADQRSVSRTTRAVGRFDSQARIFEREGLSLLASETGGRAIFNRGSFEDELDRVAEDMKGHYSLAYVPRHGGDGLEHRIKVKVSDRKLSVRHRPGYRDKSAEQRMAERLDGTLYLNLMANPLQVRLGVGTLSATSKRKMTVPLHVRVPADKLTFLPTADGDRARVMVQIKAQNERRRKTAGLVESFTLNPPEDGRDLEVQLDLELQEGIHVVAVGVRDEASLETSYVSTGLQIQDPAAAEN